MNMLSWVVEDDCKNYQQKWKKLKMQQYASKELRNMTIVGD